MGDTESFIEKANKVHGLGKYYYSEVNYINNHTKVNITCPTHGAFYQNPGSHLKGKGCPKCSASKGERKIIEYLDNKQIEYLFDCPLDGCIDPNTKSKLYFDFYLPNHNLIIEYDGKQHVVPTKFFGGEEGLIKLKLHDKIKNEYAEENNVQLLRIPYTEFNEIDKILDKIIK